MTIAGADQTLPHSRKKDKREQRTALLKPYRLRVGRFEQRPTSKQSPLLPLALGQQRHIPVSPCVGNFCTVSFDDNIIVAAKQNNLSRNGRVVVFGVCCHNKTTGYECVLCSIYNYFTCYILWNLLIKFYSILVNFMNLPSKYKIEIFTFWIIIRFKRTNYLLP